MNTTEQNRAELDKKIREFIGPSVRYDEFGTYLWGGDKKRGDQMIGEIRGWGAIQNLFADKKGGVDFENAEKFQDEFGKWIADAINQKLKGENSETKKENKRLREALQAIYKYYTNQEYAKELDAKTLKVTEGNVSGIDMLIYDVAESALNQKTKT